MKVLFVCKGNYFRSQMAAAIYNKLTGTNDAVSAGTYPGAPDEPEGQILKNLFPDPSFFDIMEANGMFVRENKTTRLLPEMLEEADVIVSMAEEPYIPDFLKNNPKVIWWKVQNPTFVDVNVAQETYQKIEKLVRDLIISITK